MTRKWTIGDQVVVTRHGLEVKGFVNIVDKKNGLLHIHTDSGPITLLDRSSAVRLDETAKEDEEASKV